MEEMLVKTSTINMVCTIGGSPNSRSLKIQKLGLKQDGVFLPGNWDINASDIKTQWYYREFIDFKEGNNVKFIYKKWKSLYDSIKTNGYIQNPNERFVEISIGRKGLILLDGRHRLICAQDIGIEKIPVHIVYRHPKIGGK